MIPIDMAAWPRAELFRFFSRTSNPFYSVTFNLDVTNLVAWTRSRGCSFYYALVALCTRAVNSVEAFRYDLSQGQVVLLEGRDPSFTDLHPGAEQFHIVTLSREEDVLAFAQRARQISRSQTAFIHLDKEAGGLIYFSCLPWIELTGLTNERNFDPDDTVPRIAWGKYVPRDGRLVLGMSVEVNHRFIDGVHIGLFARKLEELMAALS